MSFDTHANFSYSTVATAPSPASSGTSLVVATGDGAKFPAVPFNATVWPAGSQPTTSNAEIVRVTAKSTDTLTITRAQESSSARSILVGDQIAATITAKTLTDIEAYIDQNVVVVAPPTGVAATDTAAISAAITACPSGGVVQMQTANSTHYALTGSTALIINKPMTLRGRGGSDALWANFGTLLTHDTATGIGIQVQSHGVRLENFAIQNTHSTAPTAGAGIQTVSGGGNGMHYGANLAVRGYYHNIDHQAGFEWSIDPSFFSYDFAYSGLRIQNVDVVDGGDMAVSGQFIAGPTNAGHAAIQWLSGGGFKGYAIKINVRSGGSLLIGLNMELQDGVTTSDFLLSNSSVENVKYGVLCEHAGPSNTGIFSNIVLVGNQFFVTQASSTAIAIAPAVINKVSRVNVGGNVLFNNGSGTSWGVEFQNIDNATHGPNVYGGFTTSYKDNGGNTNITSVGAG